MDALPASLEGPTTLQQHLSIRLLGSPILTWNNTNLAIQRRLVRALLYRLACDCEPVARAHLQLLFWPDVPESIARRILSHLLTHLRRSLPVPQILITTRDEMQMDSNQMWCDVVEIGDAVTFADGKTTRMHTVRNLAVTTVDAEANTVAGIADDGEAVYA